MLPGVMKILNQRWRRCLRHQVPVLQHDERNMRFEIEGGRVQNSLPECIYADPYLAHPCGSCVVNGSTATTTCADAQWQSIQERAYGPCALKPQSVPGSANETWSSATFGMTAGARDAYCAAYGFVWSGKLSACAKAVGRTPCKESCAALHDDDVAKAVCPLVTIPLGDASKNTTTEINFFSAFKLFQTALNYRRRTRAKS